MTGRNLFLGIGVLLLLSACGAPAVNTAAGDWDASVATPNGARVDFRLRVEGSGTSWKGVLINGDDRNESTSGSFDGQSLRLRFDYYDAELIAKVTNDSLEGTFNRQWRRETLVRDFSARRTSEAIRHRDTSDSRPFLGEWVMRVGEGTSARLSELSLLQADGELRGTVLSVSGDWGTFTGRIEKEELKLSRFDGINARLIKAKLRGETLVGTIDMGLRSTPNDFVAERANSDNVSALPDPVTHARMRNRAEPFQFSFADLDGKLVSSTDPRFREKVVVVTITGSWCPNCHDEAPFLEDLYRRYRGKGLEVVALAFEYTGDARRDAEQLRTFARRHTLSFPILLAGTTDEGDIERKLPQLENFGGYPTTIFIGRDGLVRRIHTGFDGKATGARFDKLKAEMEDVVKSLIEE